MATLERRLVALEGRSAANSLVVRVLSLVGIVGQPAHIEQVGTQRRWDRSTTETAEQFRSRVDSDVQAITQSLVVLKEHNREAPHHGEVNEH